MRSLIIFIHAGPQTWPAYHRAVSEAGIDADWVHVSRQGLSSVYRQLARDARGSDGSILPGLLRRYGPAYRLDDYTRPGGGGVVLASYSAGYGLSTSVLASSTDRALVDGIVSIDSWHAGLDDDDTASDADLAPLVGYAVRARSGEVTCWLGHTDVPTVGYASTTQVAEELLRLSGQEIAPVTAVADAANPVLPVTHRRAQGLVVEGYDLTGTGGWTHATKEHSWALTRWGPLFLARAAVEVQQRRATAAPVAHPDEPGRQLLPLGERSLEVAATEYQEGISEVGGLHSQRIGEYFVGCERDGRVIRGPVPRTWAWCAAGLSWCMAQASRPGDELPHRRRIAVRELWADAVAAGTARPAAAIRRGDYVPRPGDAVVLTRGGYGAGPAAAPFLHSSGRGHVGRVTMYDDEVGRIHSLDANIRNAWTYCLRELADPDLVGVVAYPQPEPEPAWAYTEEEIGELRRLVDLSDAAAAGEDGIDAFGDWAAGLDSVEELEIG